MNWVIGLAVLVALSAMVTFLSSAFLMVRKDKNPILSPIGTVLNSVFNVAIGFVAWYLILGFFPSIELKMLKGVVMCVIILLIFFQIKGFNVGRKYLEEEGEL